MAGHGSAMFYFQDEFREENNISSDILNVIQQSPILYHFSIELEKAIYETAGVKNLDIVVVFG